MRQDMTSPLPPEVAEALDAVDRAVQGEALHWSMAETLREAFIAMSAKLEAAEGEVARLREDARRWHEIQFCAGMQQRGQYLEIGISTPRWRVPADCMDFNEAFDRRYELDDAALQEHTP